MRYQLAWIRSGIEGEIKLPASKSISNRLLILDSLASEPGEIRNLSDSDDTVILQQALSSSERLIDIGHAGTAMRFLTAYFSIGKDEKILTGSERMQNRPVGELVDALRSCGAEISYVNKTGYPPLKIRGKRLRGGEISIDSSISSQFISALMMIGPSLKKGLVIRLKNEMVSAAYIRLTRNLMREYGIQVNFHRRTIKIPGIKYRGIIHSVEGDWSAAGYWYAMAALSEHAHIKLPGLRQGSYQGDSVLPDLFLQFGVKTVFSGEGAVLTRGPASGEGLEFDFSDHPDLVQTLAVLCSLTGRPFHFTGTQTLRIKETDRIGALEKELKKLGITISCDPEGKWIHWDGRRGKITEDQIIIKTYQDHRMAMAFVPAAMHIQGLVIENPGVVSKSYPAFWKDLEGVGFRINTI